jgi:hypothetical protein
MSHYLATSLTMTFEYLGKIIRVGLIPFPSFRSNKGSMLMLWREISVAPCIRALPCSAKSMRQTAMPE